MKRPTVIVVVKPLAATLLITLFLLAAAVTPLASTLRLRKGPLFGCRVLLDPGHGGIDPGTGARLNVLEKDINLDMAYRLRSAIERMDGFVALSRWHDQELSFLVPHERVGRHGRDLRGRVFLADTFGPDLVVSLHVNHINSPGERGSIVFFWPESPESRAMGQAIQLRLLAMQPYSRQKALPNRRFRMLKSTPCPSVLVEIGFLSNPEDRELLADAKYRDRLAQAICKGIRDYVTRTGGKSE